MAGVALPDIFTCLQTCRKSFRLAGAILLRRCLRGRRNTLETFDVILRGRRSTFGVSCSAFLANRIVRAATSGDSTLPTLQFTLHTLHFELHTLHYTLDFTLHTFHFTPYTLHPPLHTLRSTISTPHFTLHTLHFTLSTPHSTLHTSHF